MICTSIGSHFLDKGDFREIHLKLSQLNLRPFVPSLKTKSLFPVFNKVLYFDI